MESEIKEVKAKQNLESEIININDFFMLTINSTETKEYLEIIKENINEFYLINCAHYNKINKLFKKINSEKIEQNYDNTLLYNLHSLIEHIVKMQLKSLEIFSSKGEVFNTFQNQILKLQNIIEEFSFNFKMIDNTNIYKDTNFLLNNIMNKINDLEIKVVDEYMK